MDNRPTASFYTLGCRLNQAETALIANSFAQNGYDIVDIKDKADVCVINSCTVTDQADAKCRQLVRQVLRRHPNTFVAVVGCYAQTGADALMEIDGVDLIIGTQEKMNVCNHIAFSGKSGAPPAKRDVPLVLNNKISRKSFEISIKSDFLNSTRANLKIQDGCDFMCSFCIIPFARGRARSRAFWDIQREAIHLVDCGLKELVLTGVNIGTYGHENKGFLDVVEMLLAIPALKRLRISSIEPTTIPVELLDLMAASEKLCSHLHIPLQSGADPTLAAMRRLYSTREFLEFIEQAVAKVPDILIGTDLMVGFPGESGALFEDSMAFFENAPLTYAHVFTFSERAGTAAARVSEKVDAKIKKERSRIAHEISERKKTAFYRNFIGKDVRMLAEERDDTGRWLGFSDNYVKIAVGGRELSANEIVEVRIKDVENGLAIAA